MKHLRARCGVALCVFVMSGLAVAAAASKGGDEAALRAQTSNFFKAYNGGDAKALADGYAEDAVLMPPNAPAVKGRAAIQEYFGKELKDAQAGGVVLVLDPKTDVGVSGNTGWESGAFTVTIKGNVVDAGKFLSVSRKQHGKWLYYRDTWSSDRPPAAPAK
jgi:ketosteroid isomerase-like protein